MVSRQTQSVPASRRILEWIVRLLNAGGFLVLVASAGCYGFLAMRLRVAENAYEHNRPIFTNDELANRLKWIEAAPRQETMKRAQAQSELLEPVAIHWIFVGCAFLISGYGLRAYYRCE